MNRLFYLLFITLLTASCGGNSHTDNTTADSTATQQVAISADSLAAVPAQERHITKKNFIAFQPNYNELNVDNILKLHEASRFDTTYVFDTYKLTVKRNMMPFTTSNKNVYVTLQFDEMPNNPKINAYFAQLTHNSLYFGEDTVTATKVDKNLSLLEMSRNCGKALIDAFKTSMAEDFFNEDAGQSYSSDYVIYWANNKVVTYQCNEYSYLNGAAHGNSDYHLITFNRVSGKPLTFADYVLPQKEMTVRKLLLEALALELEYESAELFLEFEKTMWLMRNDLTVRNFPIESVGMTSQGLVFSYSKYSIAAGACGCPTVILPYSLIADCLKPTVR